MRKPDEYILVNNIRVHRFHNGEMTQSDLAKAVDVSRQTIIAIEKGRFNPSVLLSMKIARLFGCRVDDIFKIVLIEEDKDE